MFPGGSPASHADPLPFIPNYIKLASVVNQHPIILSPGQRVYTISSTRVQEHTVQKQLGRERLSRACSTYQNSEGCYKPEGSILICRSLGVGL